MNIHFTDTNLFENLQSAALCRLEIGSKMYGIQHAESDIDYLYILPRTKEEIDSFLSSHHQLQYKDMQASIDHNFTNLYAFINNCISGDNTINFECLHSKDLRESPLKFLYNLRLYFYNYNIIKAYLGFCDRDIRHYGRHKTMKDKASAIIHIKRGFTFAKNIFGNKFQLIDNEIITFAKEVRQAYKTQNYEQYEKELPMIQQSIKDFRQNEINKAMESKLLPKILLPEYQKELDEQLQYFVNQSFYQEQQTKISATNAQKILALFYDAHENWVSY